jgi:ATP-dependent protease ClpP protease subunit
MSTDCNDIIAMAEAHLKHGTTSIVPTTLATPIAQLKDVTLSIKKASEKSKKANILGLHYEGPYISLKYKGAQSPENILNPTKNPPDELFELWDKILIMGAAPEEDGCLELGDKLKQRGIVASVAHSAASYEKVEEAVKHGFSDVTHIYNACTSCFKEGIFRVAGVVEAGLALAELIAGMKKPVVSLVLGGGHSIGVPLAVSAKKSFIVPSATMTVHPVRMNGLVLGVPQTLNYFQNMQERIVRFVCDNSGISPDRFRELMHATGGELVTDVGTVLGGETAVKEGLIDHVGTLGDAMECLYEMIKDKQ